MSARDMLRNARQCIEQAQWTGNKRWLVAARTWLNAAQAKRMVRL